MLLAECRSPVDIQIGLGIGRLHHLDQFFFEQLFDLQPRSVFGAMHQCGIQYAQFEFLLQFAVAGDFGAQRVAGHGLPHALQPGQHQRVAQADLGADRQQVAIALRQRQIAPRRFPGLHQLCRVGDEPLAIGCQFRACPIAHEKPAVELLLQVAYARGDGGLGDVQAIGGGDEAAAADDLEKGAGEIDIHAVLVSGKLI